MSASCTAFAYATESSLSTFSATAAFTGAATFALMSDIAARSGSGSPASFSSSSRVSLWYCSSVLPTFVLPLLRIGLRDVGCLLCVRIGDRAVARDVQRDGRVDRRRDVCVDERHGRPLGERLARELLELLGG